MNDPRTEIEHPINIGQVYEDTRTDDLSKIIYLDEDIVLLRDEDGDHHRLIPRDVFDGYVGSGRYSLKPEVEFGYAGRLEALRNTLDHHSGKDGRVHAHRAEALSDALSLLTEETAEFEKIDYSEVDGIGAKAASNLHAAGYSTVDDIKQASDDDLLEVSWVGEKGVNALRERHT